MAADTFWQASNFARRQSADGATTPDRQDYRGTASQCYAMCIIVIARTFLHVSKRHHYVALTGHASCV